MTKADYVCIIVGLKCNLPNTIFVFVNIYVPLSKEKETELYHWDLNKNLCKY